MFFRNILFLTGIDTRAIKDAVKGGESGNENKGKSATTKSNIPSAESAITATFAHRALREKLNYKTTPKTPPRVTKRNPRRNPLILNTGCTRSHPVAGPGTSIQGINSIPLPFSS